MQPKRPYLVRAIYDWIMDNGFTPYLAVDANYPETLVPQQFVQEGQIVLNISTSATGGLSLGDERIEFNARFGGKPMHVVVPMGAVMALYAKENGDGSVFPDEEHYVKEKESHKAEDEAAPSRVELVESEQETPEADPEVTSKPSGRPTLTVVK